MDKEEKKLEEECCMIARRKGLAAVKLEKNGHKGIPDRIIIAPGGRVLFVEFKNPNGKGIISDEQHQWADFIGNCHGIVDSVRKFEELIRIHFNL